MTALDFYNVDKSLATTAFSTVVTYMIILIQFDLCKSTSTDVDGAFVNATASTSIQTDTSTMPANFTTAP